MKMYKYIFAILSVITISCQKDIEIDVPAAESKIVIEGAIESEQYPYVIVTKNQGYFDPVDTNSLAEMMVLNAIVTVSDGITVDSLKIQPNFLTVPPYRYVGSKIKGQVGGTYKLKVEVDGKVYESTTTIPKIVPLDSIKYTYQSPNDTFGMLWAYGQDPPELGNFYRVFTKTFGKDSVFVHPSFSLGDDKLANGQYIEDGIIRGKDPARPAEEYETEDDEPPYWAFLRGETVAVKFCTMDVISYDFWKTAEQQASNNGNPFAAPTTIKTNISGNALGVWTGYGVFLDTVTITDDIIIEF
jgi:hypothetical protein